MNAERDALARRIFLEACDLPRDRRPQFLDEACAGDAELRGEVEALLASRGDASGSSEGPTAPPSDTGDERTERPPADQEQDGTHGGHDEERDGGRDRPNGLGGTLSERYEILRELGRGGMGRVYQAIDRRFQRTVALKELAIGTDLFLNAFEREARLLNGLRHRSLPVVTDFFADRDRFFLVMDYVAGKDLKELMAERIATGLGPLPLEQVLRWADQLLDALEYLGSFTPPIVHRDIKPQNLKLTPVGDVVLLDFGLAKGSVGPSSGRLRSIPGFTPYFAPLEQIQGTGTDPRSDLYALGVTLYYLLTGQLPPDAYTRAEAVLGRKQDPLLGVHEVNSLVPVSVAAVVRAAMGLRRGDRPQNAAAMRAALHDAARGETAPFLPVDTQMSLEPAADREEDQDSHPTNVISEATPNNLPQQMSGFIGRERDVDEIFNLHRAARLLTLTGPGGIGKTRLALRVVSDLLESYPDGVWFMDLAPLAEPELVARAVALAFNVDEQPGETLVDALCEAVRPKSALLILDNCEHVIGACADLVKGLLRACPRLRVIATSRERLGIEGEVVWPIGPMSVPERGAALDPAGLAESEAVRLFIARARQVRPAFALTRQNAALLAALCRRLDGIPLAIELAAARVNVLSVEQIHARLDDRFKLLTSGDRTSPTRQQTLRGAVDWSYDLLRDEERMVLQLLSVFPAGCGIEAAEAVAGAGVGGQGSGVGVSESGSELDSSGPTPDPRPLTPDQILDVLARLVDKSLVRAEEREGEVRFRMLETIREYGVSKLRDSGGEAAARRAMLDWALRLAARGSTELTGPDQHEWIVRLADEHDNFRAALQWGLADEASSEASLELATALVRFWHLRGFVREGLGWIEQAIARCPNATPPLRAEALRSAGIFANMQADFARAQGFYEQSLEIARRIGDPRALGNTLSNLAITLRDRGEFERAAECCAQSLELFRRLGDRRLISVALLNQGAIAQDREDYAHAIVAFEECLALKREIGDRFGIANALTNLAGGAIRCGEYERALALLEESLELRRGLGERRGLAITLTWVALAEVHCGRRRSSAERLREALAMREEIGDRRGTIDTIEGFARLACALEQWERALVLAAAASAARKALGAPITPMDLAEIREPLEQARAALGERPAERALATGRTMALAQAIAYALEGAIDTDASSADPRPPLLEL